MFGFGGRKGRGNANNDSSSSNDKQPRKNEDDDFLRVRLLAGVAGGVSLAGLRCGGVSPSI